MTFQRGRSYALKDPERYDDEFGEGYCRAEVAGDGEGMFITDCWITNEAGEIHPGMNQSPVPVRYVDIDPTSSRQGLNIGRDQ